MSEDVTKSVSVGVSSFPFAEGARGASKGGRDLLRAFTAISKALNLAQPLSDTLDLVAEKVSQTMGHKYCAVLLADEETRELRLEGSFGLSEEYVRALNAELVQRTEGEGPEARSVTAQAYRTRMPVYAPDITVDPRFERWRQAALEAGYKSIVALPLIFRDEVIGVLNCYDEPRRYSEDQVEALMVVAEQAASAVGIARLLESQRSTIEKLNALNERVVAHHALLERSERTHEALTALLLEDRSMDDITATLSRLLDAPVVLQDEGLAILSRAAPDGKEYYEGLPTDERELEGCDPPLIELREARRAGLLQIARGGSPRRALFLAPVDLGGHSLGYLTMPSEGMVEIDFCLRTLEQASTVYALYMTRQRIAQETEEKIKGDLLTDLLLGRYRDGWEARERARYLGLDYSFGSAALLVVRHEPLSGYLERAGRNAGVVGQARGRMLTSLRRFATKEGGILGTCDDRLVTVLPCRQGESARRPAEDLLLLLEKDLPGLRVRVGVSSPCASPEDLADRYEETGRLVDLAESLGAVRRVICHDDWKVYGLLLRGQDKDGLLDLAHGVLDPLLTREDGPGDLMATLRAYLDNDLSPTRTARVLYVHHNTVKYRLGRISDLLTLDLTGLDGALTAKVALMVRSLDPTSFDAAARGKATG